MRRMLRPGVFGLSLALGAWALLAAPATARAQDDGDDVVYSKKDQAYKHKEGEYGGVTPGVIYPYDDKDFKKRIKRPTNSGKRKNRVTWVGFQPQDGGNARVFIQLTSELEYSQAVLGDRLEVYLPGARLANANARRRLDTTQFETSISEVKAQRVVRSRGKRDQPARPAGVSVTVRFKDAGAARQGTASVNKEEDGYYYLFLDFGAAP
ncbi:MAG TPA: hypothetical protein VML75_12365 [Kofleriaceae bacterium]|nr:hypothetical protein [Kofleriaceae bacterium]